MRWDREGEAPQPDKNPNEWGMPEGEYDLSKLAQASGQRNA